MIDYFYVLNPKDDDGESQTTKDPEPSNSTSATTRPTKAPPIVGKYHCKIDSYPCLQIKNMMKHDDITDSLYVSNFSVWIE